MVNLEASKNGIIRSDNQRSIVSVLRYRRQGARNIRERKTFDTWIGTDINSQYLRHQYMKQGGRGAENSLHEHYETRERKTKDSH